MRPTTIHAHAAAIADYRTSGDSYAVVAARHGISRSHLHGLVNPRKNTRGGRFTWRDEDLAYDGGWVQDGLIRRPLMPERRSA